MTHQDKAKIKLNAKLCTYIDDRDTNDEISGKIKSLIEQGANINFQDPNFDGNTPLHIAVEKNDVKCVEFIFKLGVDLEITNDDGEKASDLAVKNRNSDILQLFQSVSDSNSEENFFRISSECILDVETADDFKNSKGESKIKIVRTKHSQSLDEICKIFDSDEFRDFVLKSPGLFALDVKINIFINQMSDIILKAKFQKILTKERSWIVQVKCGEKNHKIFFKESKNLAKVVQKNMNLCLDESSFFHLLKTDCTFENLMQGFFHNLLGLFDGNIFDAKLKRRNFAFSELLAAAKDDGLCLRFLLAFFDLPHELKSQEPPAKKTKLIQKINEQYENFSNQNLYFLMNAIEINDLVTMKNLLNSGYFGNRAFSDVAWELKRFEILQELLKADSPFPRNFDPSVHDFSHLIKAVNYLHEEIKSGSMGKVKSFVAANPRSKFAYDSTNKSAVSVALEAKQLEIYAFLRSQGFAHGIDKIFISQFLKNLSNNDKEIIRKENTKYFKSSDSSHLFHILSKTKIAFNPGSYEKDFKIVRKILEELNEIEEIRPILKAVEHVDLTITFDFNQQGVNEMLPLESENTHGICYTHTGHIYIGAKNHENRFNEITGILIHEFSHYVMDLIYKNQAKPFLVNDIEKKKEFAKIVKDLKNKKLIVDPIIRRVFECYEDKTLWAAEMIVRVPQILSTYKNNQDKIEEIKSYAGDLFDFFYKSTLEDITNVSFLIQPKQAIMELNDLFGTLSEVWKLKISFATNEFDVNSDMKLRLIASNAPTFSFIMILEAFYEFYIEPCECFTIFANLATLNSTSLERIKSAMNSAVKPHFVVNVANSTKKQIQMLATYITNHKMTKKIILVTSIDESEALQELFKEDPEFYWHSWENFDSETHDFLISNTVNFQGHEVKLSDITSCSSQALQKIELQKMFGENLMKIGEPPENLSAGFIIPRKFSSHDFQAKNQSRSPKTLEEILEESKKIKQILISDMAGTGKTLMLKKITVELKEKHPVRWVSYIDLRSHIKSIKTLSGNILSFKGFILQMLNCDLNNFDRAIFGELYEKGRTTLLFDSFDEISPYYKEIVIKFLKSFEFKNGNQIWVATRSHLEKELEKVMNPMLFKLEILSREEQIEFLMKSWEEKYHIDEVYLSENLASNIIDQLESLTSKHSGFVGFPILLKMIAEIYKDVDFDPNETLSYYKIYQNFIGKIFLNWRERGEVSKMEQSQLDLQTEVSSVTEIHQKFAMEHIFGDEFADLEEEIEGKWTNEMVSRVGIITKDEKSCKFLHETFAEYFVAQYMIDRFHKKRRNEIEIELFLKIIVENNFRIVRSFLESYLDTLSQKNLGNFNLGLETTIQHKQKTGECKGVLYYLVREGQKKIFDSINFQSYEKSSLEEILLDKTKTQNLFFHAVESSKPMISKLFDCFQSLLSENEAKHTVLKMFQEKNNSGNNVILNFFSSGKSEEVFDDLCSVLGKVANPEENKNLFLKKGTRSQNILGLFARNSYINLKLSKLWIFLKSILSYPELFKLLIDTETDENALLSALSAGNENFIKDLFFIIKEFSVDEQKLLLQYQDKRGNNVFNLACFCKNFSLVFECIRKCLTDDEIKILIQNKNKEKLNIAFFAMQSFLPNIFTQILDCFEILDSGNAGQIVFEMFKDKHDLGNTAIQHFFYFGNSEEILYDLYSALGRVASPEEIKNLFLEKNTTSTNILGCFASNWNYRQRLSKIWVFLESVLNSSDLFNLLAETDDEENAIHAALKKGNEDFVEDFSEILKKFSVDEQKLLLKSQDKLGNNILHSACCCYYGENKVFSMIFECSKKILSEIEIKKMFWETNSEEFIPVQLMARLGFSSTLNEFCNVFIEIASEGELKNMILQKTPNDQNIFHIATVRNRSLNWLESLQNLMDRLFGNSSQELHEMMKSLDINKKTPLMLTEEKGNKETHSFLIETLQKTTSRTSNS